MNEQLRGQVNRLRNLPQYRNKPEEEIIELLAKRETKVKEKIPIEHVDDVNIENLFDNKDERKYAKELLNKYLEDFKLETISDINLLKQLIYLEVFQRLRLQKTAETFQKENNAVPLQILDSIHKNLDKIIQLKNSLRLTRETIEQNDAFQAFHLLLKKTKIWCKENQVTRERTCPHCGKMIMWIMRPEVWETAKHPFFKDKILGNEHLVKLYSEGKLTKEDLALIFETSSDYIDWLCNKWGVRVSQVPSNQP